MSQLRYLITYLLDEREELVEIPEDEVAQAKIYKALCNMREPKPVSKEYIEKENEYLQNLLKEKGIVDISSLPRVDNPFIDCRDIISIWQGDITRLKVDAVVNPANSQGLGCFNPKHRCLDNILGTAAGVCLRNECNDIMKEKNYHLNTSEAIITNAYNLPSRYIIHTVGPIVTSEVTDFQKKELFNCYWNCLTLAKEKNIKTIAFPCISTGLFCFPKDLASRIAISAVDCFLKEHSGCFEHVIFCVFSEEDYHFYMNYHK